MINAPHNKHNSASLWKYLGDFVCSRIERESVWGQHLLPDTTSHQESCFEALWDQTQTKGNGNFTVKTNDEPIYPSQSKNLKAVLSSLMTKYSNPMVV